MTANPGKTPKNSFGLAMDYQNVHDRNFEGGYRRQTGKSEQKYDILVGKS